MNKSIKYTLLNNWHPMRWIALGIGGLFVGMGVWHWDMVSVFIGGFFLFQAATNTGCLCGNCAVPVNAETDSKRTEISDVDFTEIKND